MKYPVEELVGPFVCCDHHADAVESECQRRMAERKNNILRDRNWELNLRIMRLEEKLESAEEKILALEKLDDPYEYE